MGMASVNTASEGMQLCIFDLRRGQQEGQELDKILFFFPADLPFATQLSVIGLSEGLITFTRIFSPDAACEVIEAERHSHVFFEAESDIWMVMVVEKSKESKAACQVDALRKVLKEVHSLFVLFHGTMRSMLEKETSGGLIRSHLYPFITDYLSDFLIGKKLQLPSFHDCLMERGTVQMLTVGREAAIEVQDDTISLFTYAVLRWFRGNDGFLASDIWGADNGSQTSVTPIVYLQLTEERMYLCAYQYKSLTIILLVPVSSILNGEQGLSLVKQQVLENVCVLSVPASLKMLRVEEKLSKGWGGENAYHVSGYRYLLVDDERVSRASPPAKVMTLAKDSLLAMSKLREEVNLEKKAKCSSSEVNCDKELEICVRAKNGAWVIARTSRGKELYMVLEKASETLLYASDAVEKFSNRYCSGVFSLD
ncbi:unnamed protein product [Linum tenue]|uniref:CCZ1/INTU/HSP4 first Longin domain-containing protein n=1 Tax=Linum tenue TaxID=586396 RepID=A0AAV0HRS8_9ROSI|nr:unnamed protein product [Linum tenue]